MVLKRVGPLLTRETARERLRLRQGKNETRDETIRFAGDEADALATKNGGGTRLFDGGAQEERDPTISLLSL